MTTVSHAAPDTRAPAVRVIERARPQSAFPDLLSGLIQRACDVFDACEVVLVFRLAHGSVELLRCGDDLSSPAPDPEALLQRLAAESERPLGHATLSSAVPWRWKSDGDVFAVPIDIDDAVVGGLWVRRPLDHPPSGATEELARSMAATAGAVIHNLRREHHARRGDLSHRASLEVTRQLQARVGREQAVELIVECARRVADADDAGLILQEEGSFVVAAAAGGAGESFKGERFPVGGLASLSMEAREPVIVRDTELEPRVRMPAGAESLRSLMFVPLPAGDRVLGSLILGRTSDQDPFDQDDLELVLGFAAHAALALELGRGQEDEARLAVYRDRERIALDLHDFVIQRLFAAGLALQSLRAYVPAGAAVQRVESIGEDLDATIADIRGTIFALQSSSRAQRSLRQLILQAGAEATLSLGFEPQLQLRGPIDSGIPEDFRTDVLAVVHETLSNVARHAKATSVTVEVVVTSEEVHVVVSDNGCGMVQRRRRSGLNNLASRAYRLRGSFRVLSAPDEGTSVIWRVPLQRGMFRTRPQV